MIGAGFALTFEHEQDGSTLENYPDAIWWAFVTCTTVGYGDHFPVTAGGRIVAVMLMLVGIAGLSLLTASVAALYVGDDDQPELDQIQRQLHRIEQLLQEAAETPPRS